MPAQFEVGREGQDHAQEGVTSHAALPVKVFN
jgi:hypothetical protein